MDTSIAARVAGLDWDALGSALDARGHAITPPLLDPAECRETAASFDDDASFRKTVEMVRHGYGDGRYRYFADPLPPRISALREALYGPLAAIANAWWERLGEDERFPDRFADFRARCTARGQSHPTPLLLDYGKDGYNCLHQDVYGELAFPLQCACLLSRPGEDFSGGEFVLVEQRPRMQSRAEVIALAQGAFVIFPNQKRPVAGKRGFHRVQVRHGVSRVLAGHRQTLGVIFHDAR